MKFKMEKALEMGSLEEVLSHIDRLMTTEPDLLTNQTVKDLPTLHYLARLPFQEEHIPHLNKLIGDLTFVGYDIDKTTYWILQENGADSVIISGFTALLASIEQRNLILLDCLLRHGARTDIRDQLGFSPYHRAIMSGEVKCLEKLFQHGARPLSCSYYENGKSRTLLPLLHVAVEEGHLDMVLYLLSKQELGVDANERSNYYMDDYRWRYAEPDWFSNTPYPTAFTPLGRALFNGNLPIVEALMKHPKAKLSRFNQLDAFLKHGDTKTALSILKYFSDKELFNYTIDGQWALHSIDKWAFKDEEHVHAEFTKKLILEFVRRGWNVNSMSNFKIEDIDIDVLEGHHDMKHMSITKYSLLHLACIHGANEIIKLLVEAGADVNSKTTGYFEMTALHIMLWKGDWECVTYLIEKGGNLNIRGSGPFGYINMARDKTFNAVELLVRFGREKGLPLLDKILSRSDVIWHGVNEFHRAVEGMNPVCIYMVALRCAGMISKEDLHWIRFYVKESFMAKWRIEEMSTLAYIFDRFHKYSYSSMAQDLADLVKLLVGLDYNLNISWREPPLRDPLIFYILRHDLHQQTSNLLLQTILKVDHLKLNVTDLQRRNPVVYLLEEWNKNESEIYSESKDLQEPSIVEAVQLLVTHGINVSGMVIGPGFKYHRGYKPVLETLCRAGVKISDDFFTSLDMCQSDFCGTNALAKEIAELKEWKEEFDRTTRFTLKHICGLRVRKMLKCIGDLKILHGISKRLKEEVLGAAYL